MSARVITLLLFGTAAACTAPQSDAPNTEPQPGLHYALGWDDSQLQRTSEGWTTTTNLGFQVRVTAGQVVTYSTTAIECDEMSWVPSLVGAAHAGHGDLVDNPATVERPSRESLIELSPLEFGRVDVQASYCAVHYLVGRGEDGLSLAVEGAFRAGENEPWSSFSITTGAANATIEPLPRRIGAQSATAVIRVVRDPSRLFDDLDWTSASDAVRAWTVLTNLVSALRIDIDEG